MQATCTSLQRHEHAYFFHAWGWGACCGVRGVRPNVPSFALLPRLASRLPPSPRLRYPAQLLAAATLAQAAATGLLPCPGFSHPAPATWLLLPCSSCCNLAAAGHPAQCPPVAGVPPAFDWPVWRNSIFPTVRSFPKQCTAQKLPSHWLQTTNAHPGSHTAPHSMQTTCTSLQRHEHA